MEYFIVYKEIITNYNISDVVMFSYNFLQGFFFKLNYNYYYFFVIYDNLQHDMLGY